VYVFVRKYTAANSALRCSTWQIATRARFPSRFPVNRMMFVDQLA
jgi:hypothetical protein